MTLLLLPALWAGFALWLHLRRPLRLQPYYRFGHWLPRLLGTGAVTCLGFCFVRADNIQPKHRAHERFHHARVLALGRWRHLAAYTWHFLAGLARQGLRGHTDEFGRHHLHAYWWHPEEIAARGYAEAMADQYDPLSREAA